MTDDHHPRFQTIGPRDHISGADPGPARAAFIAGNADYRKGFCDGQRDVLDSMSGRLAHARLMGEISGTQRQKRFRIPWFLFGCTTAATLIVIVEHLT